MQPTDGHFSTAVVDLAVRLPPPSTENPALVQARARLAASLAQVTELDAEVEALAAALARFSAELEAALGAADLEARRAAEAVRRVQTLAFGLTQALERLQGPPRPPARPTRRRRPRRRQTSVGAPEAPADPAPPPPEPTASDAEGALRRVYRRLARLLHPDLASSEAERERLTATMALVNAAYAAKDLQALELTAEKVGAGEVPGLVTDDERVADLARRAAQLDRVAASLRRELQRLQDSDTAALRAEAERKRAAGLDALADSLGALTAETAAARADVVARLAAVDKLVVALTAARSAWMTNLDRRGEGGVRRGFDPLAESDVVRRAAARLRQARVGAEARALARWLEDAVATAVPDAALTLLAFFAEAGSEVPPPSLATTAAFSERWDALRTRWPASVDLATTLAHLPPHLRVGARAGRHSVQAGVQLASAELLEGVALALEHPAVASLAREVFAALGPELRCEGCAAAVRALHLHATRGLDERHALVCPSCGALLQRYWRFGALEGLEALWRRSLELGVTVEVVVRLASASLSFGLVSAQRDALTAAALLERFEALYLTPNQVTLPPGGLVLRAGGRTLEGRARVPAGASLSLHLTRAAGTTAEALLELLRERVERRFRPAEAPSGR